MRVRREVIGIGVRVVVFGVEDGKEGRDGDEDEDEDANSKVLGNEMSLLTRFAEHRNLSLIQSILSTL